MAKITVLGAVGVSEDVEADIGQSLMEIIRSRSQFDMEAACGGSASCGTCHITISSEFLDRLPAIGEDEEAMLSMCERRAESSRLSCQVRMTEVLDGLQVTIIRE